MSVKRHMGTDHKEHANGKDYTPPRNFSNDLTKLKQQLKHI